MWKSESHCLCWGQPVGTWGAVRERGGLVRAEETPAPRPLLVTGAGKTKSLSPKDACSNWLQINSHTGSFQKRRNRL